MCTVMEPRNRRHWGGGGDWETAPLDSGRRDWEGEEGSEEERGRERFREGGREEEEKYVTIIGCSLGVWSGVRRLS